MTLFNILPPLIFVVALAVAVVIVARKLPKIAREKEPEVGELEKVEATAKARAKQIREGGKKLGGAVLTGTQKAARFISLGSQKISSLFNKRSKQAPSRASSGGDGVGGADASARPVLKNSEQTETPTLADEPAAVSGEKTQENQQATVQPQQASQQSEELSPEEEAKQRELKRLLEEGSVYFKSKNYDSAESSFIRAVGVSPQNLEAYLGLGEVYLKKGEYKDALNSYQEVLRIDNDNFEAYTKLGEAFFKQEKYKDSVDAYRKALKINPEQVSLNASLAEALRKIGHSKKSIKHYREALENDPDNIDFKLGLAKSARDGKDLELANALVADVLKKDPDNPEAQRLRIDLKKSLDPSQ